jgi:hypothetical protein
VVDVPVELVVDNLVLAEGQSRSDEAEGNYQQRNETLH